MTADVCEACGRELERYCRTPLGETPYWSCRSDFDEDICDNCAEEVIAACNAYNERKATE